MKYLLVALTLMMVGCTDKHVCEMVKGSRAFFGMSLTQCSAKGFDPGYTRVQIIHDYIFTNGQNACADHEGLHYVVQKTTIKQVGDNEDYPCSEITKFRCQDGTVHNFDTGIGYCFISESQLQETL